MHYYNFMKNRKQDKCIAHPSIVPRPNFLLVYIIVLDEKMVATV